MEKRETIRKEGERTRAENNKPESCPDPSLVHFIIAPRLARGEVAIPEPCHQSLTILWPR